MHHLVAGDEDATTIRMHDRGGMAAGEGKIELHSALFLVERAFRIDALVTGDEPALSLDDATLAIPLETPLGITGDYFATGNSQGTPLTLLVEKLPDSGGALIGTLAIVDPMNNSEGYLAPTGVGNRRGVLERALSG